ncbi:MAG: hypothetical protein OSA93_02590 [Akkermansiaceae bacterium]|nr:hypothetical protein [Akkermansiaceae bacterium]
MIVEGTVGKIEVIKEFIYPLPGKKKEFKTENLGVIETFRIHPLNSEKKSPSTPSSKSKKTSASKRKN